MDELITWLRAQLDQQQAAIEAYRDHRAGLTPCDNLDGYDSCSVHIATAAATEYRDPDFGLAEIDAKRRILDWAVRAIQVTEADSYQLSVEDVVRLLAQPYDGRPGWREEWRP